MNTERDLYENARACSEDSPTTSRQELERFVSSALHDLRSPLNSASALAQLFLKKFGDGLDPEAQWIVGQIVKQLERQSALLTAIKEFASAVGTQSLSLASVPLNRVIDAALHQLRREILETGAEIDRSPMPVVTADEAQLTMVFQKILANAIRYRASESPKIHITSTAAGNCCRISISDNGIGFDGEYVETIFEPFRRLHGSDLPGSGLGLAMSRVIIQRHQGRIWAEAVTGQGAIFHIELPMASVGGGQPAADW